ncbi:MAG TPA: ATP-binding protein, partial [Pyrinomonadaceae bacterium]|nr:ATP-binding protein [Pyrinomonadaceae bacterium]
ALTDAKDAEERLRKTREERLAELEKVRSRIATDLHDDIGASLTQIAILSEVARTQNGKANGSSQDPLAKITDVSNELVGVMSDIVWSINPAKDHLSDLTQRMRRFASDLFSPNGIDVRFLATEAHDEVTLGSNLRREVFLVFKESVNNIVKHSGAKSVRIDLGIADGELRYHISDDGRGFDLSDPGGSGNGLASMRKRAAEIGGKLTVNSEPGTGTSVSLSIPLERPAVV